MVPVDDMKLDGGKLAMAGTGQPQGAISVREQGEQGVIGSANVLANGS
jgi:hypothetical protein